MKEGDFQKKLIKQLESQAAWCFNIHGHGWQKSVIPDVLIIHPRLNGFVELKAERREAEPLQRDVAKAIKKRLFPAFVIRAKDGIGPYSWNAYDITIEDFYGNVLCRPESLAKVLDCLQELVEKDNLFTKVPSVIYSRFREAKDGDAVYFMGKVFLCQGDMK